MKAAIYIVLVLFIIIPADLYPQVFTDIEAGRVYTGYNDVRIPGDKGTKFSLKDDLPANTEWFYRVRAGYLYDGRHYFSALYAPLMVRSSGVIDKEIKFRDTVFPTGTPIDAEYKFNSYRLSYRYNFSILDDFTFGAGLTCKVRHAAIMLKGGGQKEEKTDLGVVPLVNFMATWTFFYPLHVFIGGDALVSKFGRAEDVSCALMYSINRSLTVYAGYRVLEGGADNSEVYTFAMFHYMIAGVTYVFN